MRKSIENIINYFEKRKACLFTFHIRPSRSDGIDKAGERREKTAIVIQGPIITERDFTLETVRAYKKMFPGSPIILSTWIGEPVEKFKGLDIELILNEKPMIPGISHINYQIVSSTNGALAAKRIGARFILKTRTDQRLQNERSLAYLEDLILAFPIDSGKRPKGRIVAIDMNTFKYRPYSVSDMLLFGYAEDMLEYWNGDHDQRDLKTYSYDNVLEWSKGRLCEVYLSSNYLERMGEKLEWTLSDSWKRYAEYFCIADRAVIDLYWFKYDRHKEYRRRRYDGRFMNEEFGFADWLRLYNSKEYSAPEDLLQRRIEEKIKQ